MTPKLSIIIPAYNVELYIRRCLDSILCCNVSETEYELIVINDGSKDATGKICREFADTYPQLIYIDQENKGMCGARNVGINSARGEFLAFVDADDYVSKNYINTILSEINMNPNTDLFLFDYISRSNEQNNEVHFDCYGIAELFEFVSKQKINSVWDKVFRREIIMNNAIYFKDVIPCEDIVFLIDFVRHVRLYKKIDEYLYTYFPVPTGTIKNPKLTYFGGLCEANKSILDFTSSISIETNKLPYSIEDQMIERIFILVSHLIRRGERLSVISSEIIGGGGDT